MVRQPLSTVRAGSLPLFRTPSSLVQRRRALFGAADEGECGVVSRATSLGQRRVRDFLIRCRTRLSVLFSGRRVSDLMFEVRSSLGFDVCGGR